jgi:hypothetical protein
MPSDKKSKRTPGAETEPASDFTGSNGGNRGNDFPADYPDKRGLDPAKSASIREIRGNI